MSVIHVLHSCSKVCILEVVDILKVKIMALLENDFETYVRSFKEKTNN